MNRGPWDGRDLGNEEERRRGKEILVFCLRDGEMSANRLEEEKQI